ncbi:F-box-like domain-containing protein, partial [Gammaproteobacteria bacterium]|nr:F-box-like domain-containing protein [Gammaproteobacteria bacterium]
MRKEGIDSLPDTLWLHILKIFLVDSEYHFGQLAKLRLVCKKFKSLASSNALWKHLFPYSSKHFKSSPNHSWYQTAIQMETGIGGLDYGVFRHFLTVVHVGLIKLHLYKYNNTLKDELDKGGKALRENLDLILFLVKHVDADCFKEADITPRSCKEVVMAAIEQNGFLLEHADLKLKADREVVLTALNAPYET